MREELEMVEQYSIDEAFFQIEEEPEKVASRLKNAVEKQVGIPVSVGVARTKTQAKYANSLAKKSDGICVLDESAWLGLVPEISLSKIWGVGGKLELRYKQHGLTTVAKLLSVDTDRIASIFGVIGVSLQQELAGQVVFKLGQKTEPQKSIMSSRSFRDVSSDIEVLADALAYHVRHAVADLRAMRMKTSVIRVSIRPGRHGDFLLRGGSKEVVLPTPTNDTVELLKVAHGLLEQLFEPDVPYKKAGITLSHLQSVECQQESLFLNTENKKDTANLMSVIDGLNNKKGKELILLGSRLLGDKWRSRADVESPAYTTRWNDVALAKAK